jgi:hypothetical protein
MTVKQAWEPSDPYALEQLALWRLWSPDDVFVDEFPVALLPYRDLVGRRPQDGGLARVAELAASVQAVQLSIDGQKARSVASGTPRSPPIGL